MNSKLFFLFIVFSLTISLTTKAQFESINLNAYKATNYKYKTLGTQLNAVNRGSYSNSKASSDYFSSKSSSNLTDISGAGYLDFSFTRYNRSYQGHQRINLGGSSNFSDYSNNYSAQSPFDNFESSSKRNSNSSAFFLDIYSHSRFFLDSDFYWGFTLSSNQAYANSYSKTEYDTENTKQSANQYNSRNRGKLQFGKGRVENVTDARLAIYILDDLLKQGRLSRTPSENEVFAFADFINKTLNTRVIDSRIKRIKESVAIDSFLVSQKLSTNTDGLYFGLINDNWNYARTQYWDTGSEWYFGLSPFINYSNRFNKLTQEDVTKTRSELSEYGLSFDAGYSSRWINGLKWINGYNLNASFNIFKYDTVGSYYNGYRNYKSISGMINYFTTYLPNTRTSITGSAGLEATKYLGDNVYDELIIKPNISGNCNYYFSEKLRLGINARVSYNLLKHYEPNLTANGLMFELSATLQYYIF